jgi:hypothetical protein
VFNYGHTTIPRHLRDIVVTEYGIADLRGRTDSEVAMALIGIADARFQAHLADCAKSAGKLPDTWRIPQEALDNTPARLAARLAPLAAGGRLPRFPLGTDFDACEQRLVPALQWLKGNATGWRMIALAAGIAGARATPEDTAPLERMGLSAPRGVKEGLLRRALLLALSRTR